MCLAKLTLILAVDIPLSKAVVYLWCLGNIFRICYKGLRTQLSFWLVVKDVMILSHILNINIIQNSEKK